MYLVLIGRRFQLFQMPFGLLPRDTLCLMVSLLSLVVPNNTGLFQSPIQNTLLGSSRSPNRVLNFVLAIGALAGWYRASRDWRISLLLLGSALCTLVSEHISTSPALNAQVTHVPDIVTAISIPPASVPTRVSKTPFLWDPEAIARGPLSIGQSPVGGHIA